MEGLASVVAVPFNDQDKIFCPEWISVQSRGIKRWVSVKLAEKFGICANCQYLFPGDIINKILLFHEKELEKLAPYSNIQTQTDLLNTSLLNKDVILWKVMANLPTLVHRPEFKEIQNYLKDDKSGVRLYQISEKIAGIFDDYLTYRPEMIVKWEDAEENLTGEKHSDKDFSDLWQPVLWNRIVKQHNQGRFRHIAGTALSFLQNSLDGELENGIPGLPERISFFGISAIPPLFLKIFEKAADCIDINFFLLIPSKEFFGYIRSAKQMGKINSGNKSIKSGCENDISRCVPQNISDDFVDDISGDFHEDFYFELGNPLLASMGGSIKNFSIMLEDLSYNEPFPDLWYDPVTGSDSMLAFIQSDILNLIHRKKQKDYSVYGKNKNDSADSFEPAEIPNQQNSIEQNSKAKESSVKESSVKESSAKISNVEISDRDRSISIHFCHGPMREAQVLKDLILDLFLENPDLKPHDFIVMMPDIETYAPYIESVFASENPVPFTISDRKRRKQSEVVETFMAILSLSDSRLTLTEVMDVLSVKSVGQKFDFSEEDITNIRKTTEKAGICWGIDSMHRKQMGFPEINENTWWFGFQRLMLGYCMPENCDFLFKDVLPCDSFEGKEAELLGKFAFFCDTLFKSLKRLAVLRTIHKWCDTFRDIFFMMMDTDNGNDNDREFILLCLDELKSSAEKACHDDDISFETAFSALKAKLDVTASSGSFFTGAVVFCNLMPMRSIPFKVVALMGMNDKDFPGQDFTESFNLMKKYPKPGDRIKRDESRYLFLEALLSARQNFIVTCTGMSVKDNSIIPPAGVVSELIDTVNEGFIFPDSYNFVFKHPLQPFSEKCFTDHHGSGFVSFSRHYYNIAVNLADKACKSSDRQDFLPAKIPEKISEKIPEKAKHAEKAANLSGTGTMDDIRSRDNTKYSEALSFFDDVISLEDLISFFTMPAEYFVKKRLGIVFPELPDFSDDREPVEMDGLENYFIGEMVLEKHIRNGLCHGLNYDSKKIHCRDRSDVQENNETGDFFPVFKASGRIPHGKKGKMEFGEIESETESILNLVSDDFKKINSEPFPVYVDIQAGGINISGNIKNVMEITRDNKTSRIRYDITFAKFSPKRILKAWICHLALNTIKDKKESVETYLVVRGDKSGKAVKIYFPPCDEAFSYLCDLVELFKKGMENPLIFFPDTSWAFAETIFKSGNELSRENIKKAFTACREKWEGSFLFEGEKINRYLSFVFNEKDFFDDHGTVDGLFSFDSVFIDNAMKIFSPVLDNMERM